MLARVDSPLHCVVALSVEEEVREVTTPLAELLPHFQSLPLLAARKLGPSGFDFTDGCVCVRSRTLRVSPTNSPVRLGVSPTVPAPTDFYILRL